MYPRTTQLLHQGTRAVDGCDVIFVWRCTVKHIPSTYHGHLANDGIHSDEEQGVLWLDQIGLRCSFRASG